MDLNIVAVTCGRPPDSLCVLRDITLDGDDARGQVHTAVTASGSKNPLEWCCGCLMKASRLVGTGQSPHNQCHD